MMVKDRKALSSAGFTLVEIMVVVVILGLLAGMGAVGYKVFLDRGYVGTAKAECARYNDAIDAYMTSASYADVSVDEIWERMIEEKILKKKNVPKDPWGQPYEIYVDDDGDFIVFSKGKNKRADDEDDVFADGLRSEREED